MKSNNEAQKMNFWELITYRINSRPLRIIVPDLQRDYAEGRSDAETEQIRKNLILDICKSLVCESEKNLNFIYGTITEKNNRDESAIEYVFSPVDGQQRLTTLFLLYWFVFYNTTDNITRISDLNILNSFSYQTRTTTEDFCSGLCNKFLKPATCDDIEKSIRNQNWFTGNIAADPSVQSMLIVLKEIQSTLTKLLDENNTITFDELARRLKNDSKITFFWLDIGNFNEEDLYIKMNSRGKYLTEFESFKARLQPSENNRTILNDVFGSTKDAVDFIGRINNEYTNSFYRDFGIAKDNRGVPEFDTAMMNFFVSVIKCDQFAYIAGIEGLDGKKYRDIFNAAEIGSVFYERFVHSPMHQWTSRNILSIDSNKLNSCLVHSFRKIDYFLSRIDTLKGISNPFGNRKFDKYQIDSIIQSNKKTGAKDHLRQYAIMEYLFRVNPDLSNEESLKSYYMWVRFVSNVIENAKDSKGDGFSDTADTCETIYFFKYVIDLLLFDSYRHLNRSLLNACISFSNRRGDNRFPPSIRVQMEEELQKLELMSEDPDNWECRILEAENYFEDGQIRFILDYYKDDNLIAINPSAFDDCFDIAKKLFFKDKTPNTQLIKWDYLQTAAFRCEDHSPEKSAYLTKKTNWCMHDGRPGVSSYRSMLSGNDLKTVFLACRDKDDIDNALQSVAQREYSIDERWKIPFAEDLIKKMLIYNNQSDNNKFSFSIAFRNDTILLLCRDQRTSGPSMEIHTFLLFTSLSDNIQKTLEFESGDKVCDEDGIPLRFIKVGNKKVGYSPLSSSFIDVENAREFTLEKAKEYLETA